MNRKSRLVLLYTGILLTLSVLLFFSSAEVFAHSLSSEENVVIHMQDDGFVPRKLIIEKGATVIFENVGENDHWPASNLHPTHRIYPDSDIAKCGTEDEAKMFDSCRGFKKGENYSFSFLHEGVWRFHDHLNPGLKGTITVEKGEDESESNETTFDDKSQGFFSRVWEVIRNFFTKLFRGPEKSKDDIEFMNGKQQLEVPNNGNEEISFIRVKPTFSEDYDESARISDIHTKNEILGAVLQKIGIGNAMAKLLEESGGGSEFDCHTAAHNIGRVGYEIYQESAFQDCNASCHSGCYHGAMEALLHEKGTQELARNVNTICDKSTTRFGRFECLHGVGHGVMAYVDYDMPEALIECDKLADSFEQTSCYGGVFMENIVTGQGSGARGVGHVTDWVNREDPHYPCIAIDQNYDVQYQCYQMQTGWMLTLFNSDFSRVAMECLTARPDMVPVCYKSFGRDAAGYTFRDPVRILQHCDKVPTEYHEECVTGAVNVIIDFWGPELGDQASEFCSLVSDPSKKSCFITLADRISGLLGTVEEKELLCSTFPPDYQYLCNTIK